MNSIISFGNIILIVLIVCIIYILYRENKEGFTTAEMASYPNALSINCANSKSAHQFLKNKNNMNCNKPGKTDRETINNKTVCYDDTGKEIVSGLDEESNCTMATRLKKITGNEPNVITQRMMPIDTTKTVNKEGPEFINTFYMQPSNDSDINKYENANFDFKISMPKKTEFAQDYNASSRLTNDIDLMKELSSMKSA